MSDFDAAAFLCDFRAEAEQRGFTTEELAQTAAGPILAFTSRSEGEPVYLSAGMHGDEPAGPLAALELLRSGFFERDLAWTICPALNPTGLAANTRENAGGIDLNRDYLRRETLEIRAHAEWFENRPCPQGFFSLHEDWESSGFYFYEINLGDDHPERAAAIIDAVRPWFRPEPEALIDDHETRAPGWIYHHADADFPDLWPEAIFLAKRGCPLSFTFETPSSADLASRIAAHMAAVKGAVAHRRAS
ncbi:M14 family metallocarboxypeptidase [Haloferula chungangensis]|uniref:M14 family metallocarboxypeptidase n=1 Tax=Haloferula chungangensis TaxID=1048331 RepID=A0ABW2LCQ2_9BACT